MSLALSGSWTLAANVLASLVHDGGMILESLGASPVVIDGGLSTQLEVMGCRLDDPLWTARTLLDDPGTVIAAHRAFVEAGAEVVISASYQVARAGFVEAGLRPKDADRALESSIHAARSAVTGTTTLVAASVGPYGAISHDGAEYRGNYGLSLDRLATFHDERIAVLMAAGPDLLAIETIPDLLEAQALMEVLPADAWAWVSFTAGEDGNLRAGQPIEEAVRAVEGHPGVRAVGINCTEPHVVPSILSRMAGVTDLPLVAYPNAGGSWDPSTGAWVGPTQPIALAAVSWIEAGAVVVGGCCGTNSADIGRLADAIAAVTPPGSRR
jgi:homocysteine S-methyltransferase